MTWKTIDSCPRDGSHFIGRQGDNQFVCRFWSSAQIAEYEDDGSEGQEWDAGFYIVEEDGDEDGELVYPTHWQHLSAE